MALTPSEILHKEFDSKFRGYDPDQVNDFLDLIVADFEKLTSENKEMKSRMGDMQDKLNYFQQLQDSLNNSIVVAQEAAERLKQNARKEAELILYEAEREADKLYEDASSRSKLLLSETENLRKYSLEFRDRLVNMVEAQLSLINRTEYQDLFEQAEEELENSNERQDSVLAKLNDLEASAQKEAVEQQETLSMEFPTVGELNMAAEETTTSNDTEEGTEELVFEEAPALEEVHEQPLESVLGRTIRIDLPNE